MTDEDIKKHIEEFGWDFFSYGRKATPERIGYFPLPHTDDLLDRVDDYLARAATVEDRLLADAEDALDSQTARRALAGIQSGAIRLVSGDELAARLAALEAD